MTPLRLFRPFILLSAAFGVSSTAVDYFVADLMSPELSSARDNEPMFCFIENYPIISLAILLPWLAAALAGVVGLFLFKPWGRTLSLYSTVLGVFLIPFLGPVVSSGVAFSLDEVAITLWGATLALAYFSPVAERFIVENR